MFFDQIVTEIVEEGEYTTAYVRVYVGAYNAGKDFFTASATSRNKAKAIGYALEDIAKQIQATAGAR